MLGMSEMQLISVFNKHKVSILVNIYNRQEKAKSFPTLTKQKYGKFVLSL